MRFTVITGKQAWGILAGGIIVYEIACEDDQLLSVIVDEWLKAHPVLTRAAIVAVAAHLANALNPAWDPLSVGFIGTRKVAQWLKRLGQPPITRLMCPGF